MQKIGTLLLVVATAFSFFGCEPRKEKCEKTVQDYLAALCASAGEGGQRVCDPGPAYDEIRRKLVLECEAGTWQPPSE